MKNKTLSIKDQENDKLDLESDYKTIKKINEDAFTKLEKDL